MHGLTKLEVIVACVCLVIVLALFLPLMNDGTHSRRRTECASRLGEFAKAIMMYEMAKKEYPGYLHAYAQDDEGTVKVGTWAVALLPYIEQEPLYEFWMDPSNTGQWNRRGGGASTTNSEFYPKIRLFLCANDDNLGDMHAPSSFAVNSGFFPDILPPDYSGLNRHEIARRSSRPDNGIFTNQLPPELECVYTKNTRKRVLGTRADAPTRSSDVRDGLTNTIAITESINADSWSYVGRDSGWDVTLIDGIEYAGDDLVSNRSPRVHGGIVWEYKAQPPIKGFVDYKAPNWSSRATKRTFSPEMAIPSSFHTGTFNAAMLGGSVATMQTNMDYRVLQALMTPHGKESDAPDREYVLNEEHSQ